MKARDVEGYEDFPEPVKRLLHACELRDERASAIGRPGGGHIDRSEMALLWSGLDLDFDGVSACAGASTQLHQTMLLGANDTRQARQHGMEVPEHLDTLAREQLVMKVAHIIESAWADGLMVGELDAKLRLEEERQLIVPGTDEEQRPQPGVMHPVDKAFYDLAVKERNYERQRVDRLSAALDVATRERDDLAREVERLRQLVVPGGPGAQGAA